MADAKIYSNQRTVPIYIGEGDGFRLPGKAKWRPADAVAAILGGIVTAGLVTANVMAGHVEAALWTLIIGAMLTVAAVVVAGRLPVLRPSPIVRAIWLVSNAVPRVSSSGTTQHGG
jgi:hypothetical protein